MVNWSQFGKKKSESIGDEFVSRYAMYKRWVFVGSTATEGESNVWLSSEARIAIIGRPHTLPLSFEVETEIPAQRGKPMHSSGAFELKYRAA